MKEYTFALLYIAASIVVQFHCTFSNDDATDESWSECPDNLTVYEGCQYTIHALFDAYDRSCALLSNNYRYIIAVNEKEFTGEKVSVVPINNSETICNVSTTFNVTNVDKVIFSAIRISPDHMDPNQLECEDLLEVVNDTLGPPTNLSVSVTCDKLVIQWDPPEILPGFSIHQYNIAINSQNYFTKNTKIVISIAEAELMVNEEYLVDVSSEYCRGQGENTSTVVIIANKPAISQVNYTYSNLDESQVAVQLFIGVSQAGCKVDYPTGLTIQYSCDGRDKEIVKSSTKNVCIMDDGTIESMLTLPVDQTCDVHLKFQNSHPENTIKNISINTRYCTVQPTVEGILFECDCISQYCGCCGIQVTNINTNEMYFQSSDGSISYFKLPPGNYSIVCYDVKSCVDEIKLTIQGNTVSSLVVSTMTPTATFSSVTPSIPLKKESCDPCDFAIMITAIICSIIYLTVIIIIIIIITLCCCFRKKPDEIKTIHSTSEVTSNKNKEEDEQHPAKPITSSTDHESDEIRIPENAGYPMYSSKEISAEGQKASEFKLDNIVVQTEESTQSKGNSKTLLLNNDTNNKPQKLEEETKV